MMEDDAVAVVENFVDAGPVDYLLAFVVVSLIAAVFVADLMLVVAHSVTVVLLRLLLLQLVAVVRSLRSHVLYDAFRSTVCSK